MARETRAMAFGKSILEAFRETRTAACGQLI